MSIFINGQEIANKLDLLKLKVEPNLYTGGPIEVASKASAPSSEWQRKELMYLKAGLSYTLKLRATCTSGVEQASFRVWQIGQNDTICYHSKFKADNELHVFTFDIPNDGKDRVVSLYAGPFGDIQNKDFSTTYHEIVILNGKNSIELDTNAIKSLYS